MNDSNEKQKKHITITNLIGKEVYHTEGHLLGVLQDIIIDTQTLQIQALEIINGTVKKHATFGIESIEHIENNKIVLHIPLDEYLVGKNVFDRQGKKIGQVTSVKVHDDKLFLQVKDGTDYMSVHEEFIEHIGKGVLLTCTKNDIYS